MAIRYADWTNGQDFSIKRDRTTAIAAWSAATTYALDALVHDAVTYPNRKCYKSLQAGNLNHALTDVAWWVLVADGSAALPFQSITDATQGLTGGDECRVAESPADTPLSGTLTFTEGSTTLTGSGTAFATELVIGDFVLGGDGYPYEVITISSDTAAVLYKVYPESTQAEIACVKVGMTETGAAASSSTQVQVINSSGVSTSNRLLISGGWNLAIETQTGTTKFKQLHGTFATRNGRGIYNNKTYIEMSKCHFFRYYYGIGNYASNNLYNAPICNSNQDGGIFISSSTNIIVHNPVCNSNNSYGIYFNSSSMNLINNLICNANGTGSGVIFSNSNDNILVNPIFKYNAYGINCATSNSNIIDDPTYYKNTIGFSIGTSNYNIINNPICTSNNYGVMIGQSYNNIINNIVCNSNTVTDCSIALGLNNVINTLTGTGIIAVGITKQLPESPALSIQNYLAKGDNRNYFYGGITKSNTANARSGKCLEYNPTSVDVYMSHSFFFKAVDATACTLSAYVQKTAAFDGDVQGAVYFLGLPVIDWTDITPTANDTYEKKSFSVTSGMVTDDSVLELRIKVRGTAGAVYVDDLEQV
ncbi:MAG: NosD domain-containing protein [Methanobacterium sp.]